VVGKAASGRKFETSPEMQPVFAELDTKGWNDWPPGDSAGTKAPTPKPQDGVAPHPGGETSVNEYEAPTPKSGIRVKSGT
jgi:hypothetical protein